MATLQFPSWAPLAVAVLLGSMLGGCIGERSNTVPGPDQATVHIGIGMGAATSYDARGLELRPFTACVFTLQGPAEVSALGYSFGTPENAFCAFPGPTIVVPDGAQVTLEMTPTWPFEVRGVANSTWTTVGENLHVVFEVGSNPITLVPEGNLRQLGAVSLILPESVAESGIPVVYAGHLHSTLLAAESPAHISSVCWNARAPKECVATPPADPDLFLVNGNTTPIQSPAGPTDLLLINHGVTTLEVEAESAGNGRAGLESILIPAGEARLVPLAHGANTSQRTELTDAARPGPAWWGSPGPSVIAAEDTGNNGEWTGRLLPTIHNTFRENYENTSSVVSQIHDRVVVDFPLSCALEEVRIGFLQTGENPSPQDLTGFDMRVLDRAGREVHAEFVPHGQDWQYTWKPENRLSTNSVIKTWEIEERGGTGTRVSGGIFGEYDFQWANHFADEAVFRCLIEGD